MVPDRIVLFELHLVNSSEMKTDIVCLKGEVITHIMSQTVNDWTDNLSQIQTSNHFAEYINYHCSTIML